MIDNGRDGSNIPLSVWTRHRYAKRKHNFALCAKGPKKIDPTEESRVIFR